MIVIACNSMESITAAAALIRIHPDAEIHITSAGKIEWSLSRIKNRREKELHIIGPGIYCEPMDVFNELRRLHGKGWKVHWYFTGPYLEPYQDEIRKYANFVQHNSLSLISLVIEENNINDSLSSALLDIMEKREGEKYEFYADLIHSSIQRYFKFLDYDAVPGIIGKIANPELISETDRAEASRHRRYGARNLVGKSLLVKELKRMIGKVGEDPYCRVLIMGETGTGKETVARLIHECSPRKDGPFFAISCANLDENLLETKLFGHEKGAFTGASERRPGVFEMAAGGTLFLDEIAEMPLQLQPRLLRVLQEGAFIRVGGSEEIKVNVRVISATNKDILKEVKNGRFREDLYYRINEITMKTPALREHSEDVKPIAEDILYRLSLERSKEIPRLKKGQIETLIKYSWPGNVRELEGVLLRAIVLWEWNFDNILSHSMLGPLPEIDKDRIKPLAEHEKEYVLSIFNALGGNKTRTAKALGISLNTLKLKLQQYQSLPKENK